MNDIRIQYEFDLKKLMEDIRGQFGKKATLRDIGNAIGISASTLSRMDNGQHPDIHTFMQICSALDFNPSDYFIRYTWKRVEE